MNLNKRDVIVWIPRVLGLALAGSLSLFATDRIATGRGIAVTIVDVAMGLIPALIVLGVVAVGWKRQGVAAVAFLGLAGLYAVAALRHLSWILVISGPLIIVGLLFFASWRVMADRKSGIQQVLGRKHSK